MTNKTRQAYRVGQRRGIYLHPDTWVKLKWLCDQQRRSQSNMIEVLVAAEYERQLGPDIDPAPTS